MIMRFRRINNQFSYLDHPLGFRFCEQTSRQVTIENNWVGNFRNHSISLQILSTSISQVVLITAIGIYFNDILRSPNLLRSSTDYDMIELGVCDCVHVRYIYMTLTLLT